MLGLHAEVPVATSKRLSESKITKEDFLIKGNGGNENGTGCQFVEVTLSLASKTRDHTAWCAEQHARLLQLIKALFKLIQRPEPCKILNRRKWKKMQLNLGVGWRAL